MKDRKATVEEIKYWYEFKLRLRIWFSRRKGKSFHFLMVDETWYDGYWFNPGYFAFIQLGLFAIHFKFKWWKIKI